MKKNLKKIEKKIDFSGSWMYTVIKWSKMVAKWSEMEEVRQNDRKIPRKTG